MNKATHEATTTVVSSVGIAIVLLGIVMFLTACTPQLVVQEVKVPVPIPCKIVSPDKPIYPLQEAKKDEKDIFVITQKALAEIELRQGYETKLEVAITECNK